MMHRARFYTAWPWGEVAVLRVSVLQKSTRRKARLWVWVWSGAQCVGPATPLLCGARIRVSRVGGQACGGSTR